MLLQELKSTKASLDEHQGELETKQTELSRLKALQEIQQRQLAGAKQAKTAVLKDTKGQESKFQELVKKKTQDLKKLQEQIMYLEQSGITVQDAVKYGQLAALGAGIRPAFLLALLEVESRLGLNVGSGNWQQDMVQCYMRLAGIAKTQERKIYYQKRASSEEKAFLAITAELGIDPNSVKVSREPSYGCGGAMGPAQFIPTTWLGYAPSVKAQTGRSTANPWNTEDAFTAAAIKLARGGAAQKTRAGELAAAKAYISGNPNCTQAICNSYSSTILKKADDIETNL
jgi:membrane-bound lytic murein transglycosylase B